MNSKWFAHKRTRARQRQLPLRTQSKPVQLSQGSEPALTSVQTTSVPSLQRDTKLSSGRPRVVVTSVMSSKGPKTVITINDSKSGGSVKQSLSPKKSHLESPRNEAHSTQNAGVEHAYKSTPKTPTSGSILNSSEFKLGEFKSMAQLAPIPNINVPTQIPVSPKSCATIRTATSSCGSESIYEDAMESFGIEMPSSPSSTLHEPIRKMEYLNPPFFSASSEMDSLSTSDTFIDDGLSPWGLPKVLDVFEDDDNDEEGEIEELLSSDLPASKPTPQVEALELCKRESTQSRVQKIKEQKLKCESLIYFVNIIAKHRDAKSHQYYSEILVQQRTKLQKESYNKHFSVPLLGCWM